jgi:ABC-type lipoprotein export system ATPase subunit
MPETTTLLELEKVSKNYPAPADDTEVMVLRDISLEVNTGESVAVVGPSGSGKSTLLNIIGTLDSATSGRVLLDGRDLGQLGEKQLARIRNREIGFIFQLHHLLEQCTVLENVLIPTLVRDNASQRNDSEQRARRLLARVGLEHRLEHRPGQLSGGEMQRVAVVRALINQPKLLLADEPTGSLDRQASQKLFDLLAQLNREENVTLITVTHASNLARRMNRVLELRDGKLLTENL